LKSVRTEYEGRSWEPVRVAEHTLNDELIIWVRENYIIQFSGLLLRVSADVPFGACWTELPGADYVLFEFGQ
jgi:transketolase N-terminal domain/subunit